MCRMAVRCRHPFPTPRPRSPAFNGHEPMPLPRNYGWCRLRFTVHVRSGRGVGRKAAASLSTRLGIGRRAPWRERAHRGRGARCATGRDPDANFTDDHGGFAGVARRSRILHEPCPLASAFALRHHDPQLKRNNRGMAEDAHCSTCGAPWDATPCPSCGGTTRTVAMVIATTVVTDPSLVGPSSSPSREKSSFRPPRSARYGRRRALTQASAAAGDSTAVAHGVTSRGETIRTGSVTRNADSSSVGEDTSLDLSRGSTPHNEQGALEVAHAYGGRIASEGGKCWPMPFRVVATTEDPTIDVVTEERDTNGRVIARLAMQVVRPLSSDSWRALSQATTVKTSAADVAEYVMAAIRAKLRKYP